MNYPEYSEHEGSPICPYCGSHSNIRQLGAIKTFMWYAPDVPDRNRVTAWYKCFTCEKEFSKVGNIFDGWKYGGPRDIW